MIRYITGNRGHQRDHRMPTIDSIEQTDIIAHSLHHSVDYDEATNTAMQ